MKKKRYYLQLDYFDNYGKLRTKYFTNKNFLDNFIINSDIFIYSIYDYNRHKYVFICSKHDLFIFKLLSAIKGVEIK